MNGMVLKAVDALQKPDNGKRYWVLNVVMMAMVLAVTIFGVRLTHEYSAARRTLGLQVNELALRTRLMSNGPSELQTPDLSQVSPEVAAVVTKFELKHVRAAALYAMTRAQGRVAPQIFGYEWDDRHKEGEILPGLAWQGGKLRHLWGGTVDVYRNAGLILVAFSNMPNYLCDDVPLRYNAGGNSYVFACNNRLISVEQDISWEVTDSDLQRRRSVPGHPDDMTF